MEVEKQDSSAIRVMLVDDSAVVRGLMSRALQQNPRIHIVATANDGDMAISVLQRNPVDVIVLDIEMPNKDGLEALPILQAMSPHTHIIMASSLTQRNAAISLKALEIGAADYVPKPTSRGDDGAIEAFYADLQNKVLQLGAAARHKAQEAAAPGAAAYAPAFPRPVQTSAEAPQAEKTRPESRPSPPARKPLPSSIRAIAIASSTGGPQALLQLLSRAAPHLNHVAVFITQHMPATFTTLLAEHLAADTGLPCKEAVHGELVTPGNIYVAPGDYHMCVQLEGASQTIRLNQEPPVNYCRPAADPMLASLAQCYGKQLLAVVLTGMGMDGREGARAVREAGGYVLVQDEESSVVWGMPGAVVAGGFQDAILSVPGIADYIMEVAKR